MADKKEKKGFRIGLYAVVSGIIIAVVLIALTIFAFTTRYTAFSPEKTAQAYVDGIVQTGDGYDAYKTTLLSKSAKYGDFIINVYMRPYVNDGEDVKKADFVGKGNKEETKAIDKVYDDMYEYYVELLKTYGWDNYDEFFSQYFAKLAKERQEVYKDEYMDTEYMFGVLEANVQKYSEELTGTEQELAADEKTVIKEAKDGEFAKMFGKDYKLVTTAKAFKEEDTKKYVEEYKARIASMTKKEGVEFKYIKDKEELKEAQKSLDDTLAALDHSGEIDQAGWVTCEVKEETSGKVVATIDVPVVKIGKSWYVDNTYVVTSPLYLAIQ